MIRIKKEDLTLKKQVVSNLTSNSGNDDPDTQTKALDDTCPNTQCADTKDLAHTCPDTFESHCMCLTTDYDCMDSKKCIKTESGGRICCAMTQDSPKCVVQSTPQNACPTPDTQDNCIEVSRTCPETQICPKETLIEC